MRTGGGGNPAEESCTAAGVAAGAAGAGVAAGAAAGAEACVVVTAGVALLEAALVGVCSLPDWHPLNAATAASMMREANVRLVS